MKKNLPTLPIDQVMPDICQALKHRDELVLLAPPGAGKTTAVPLALLEQPWRGSKKILLLEPRRVAARAAALRMADLLGETPGERVGYRMRMDTCVGKNTVIEVITEGLLTQMLQNDPELNAVAAIIFDEFHERNLHSDLGLALSLQARALFREQDPLKIVVMSATLDGDRVAEYLNRAPVVRSEGRSFPVDIHYGSGLKLGESPVAAVVECIQRALQQHSGNILVFLPGQKEIQAVQTKLVPLVEGVAVLPLHGSLSFEQQQRAIQAPDIQAPGCERKVVLATDIAETSLTIEGVTVVVDSGLCRRAKFNPRHGFTRLHTERISRASATQRAGRAGRLAAGHCYRIWRKDEPLMAFGQPEMSEADMAPLLLSILCWGVNHPSELAWLDKPGDAAVAQGFQLLQVLGLVAREGGSQVLTEQGLRAAQLPLHPRLSHMLQLSEQQNCPLLASLLAALLSEKSAAIGGGVNLLNSLRTLTGEQHCPKPALPWKTRCLQQAKRYLALFPGRLNFTQAMQEYQPSDEQQAAVLLAFAFPDRIAKRRDNARNIYLLSNGRSAKLPEHDALAGELYLVVTEVGGFAGHSEDRVFSALPLSPQAFDGALSPLIEECEKVAWQGDKLLAQRQRRLGCLVIQSQTLQNLREEQYGQAALEWLQKQGLSALPWSENIRQWQRRVGLLRQHFPEQAWPDVSDGYLQAHLHQWLAPYLNSVRKQQDLKNLPLNTILQGLLPWPLPQQLDELAPTHYTVPSGSRLAIDYSESPPVLKVKLQEMFGCRVTPAIAGGKVRLLVHLLSPAKRPLQVTQDLEGFWNSSYQEVKKEMKGRYPKHPWPDDPWLEAPTRYTKKR